MLLLIFNSQIVGTVKLFTDFFFYILSMSVDFQAYGVYPVVYWKPLNGYFYEQFRPR